MKRAKRARPTSYPSDVTDEEWAFVAPYLTLMREDAPQREYPLRAVFNGLRWIVRAGAPWPLRVLPHDLPPWELVYQQTQRWLKAGVFEALVHDLRALLRLAAGRAEQPSAAIFDGRTLQSSPESGARAGYDGHKRKKGSKVHLAVDTLGQLLAVYVTPANEQERAQVAQLAQHVQAVTGQSMELAFVDQGYTGEQPAQAAAQHGLRLEVVKLPEAKRGFVLLPRRWVEPPFLRGWSGVSPGPPASVGWRATTNACPKPWPGCSGLWRGFRDADAQAFCRYHGFLTLSAQQAPGRNCPTFVLLVPLKARSPFETGFFSR